MNTKIRSILALGCCLALASVSGLTSGCTMTQGQTNAAIAIGTGEAVGTNLLKRSEVNGVVPATYLATYEAEIPNVAGLMQNKITPADLGKILNETSATSGLNAKQLEIVGLLNGVTGEFILANQNTSDGAVVNNAAHNFAVGLGNAVGLVTGTNYVAPTSLLMPRPTFIVQTKLLAYSKP